MKITEDSFYYKKDINLIENPNYIEVSNTVVYFPKRGQYGNSVPNFNRFLNFINARFLTQGHYNYNSLGFSAQVPNIVEFLLESNPEITYSHWLKINKIFIKDSSLFDKFSFKEYAIYDSLINYDRIFYDAYFKNKVELIKGIIKKSNYLKLSTLKIVSEAVLVRKELIELIKLAQE